MPNVLDYLDWRGDLSFDASPFCEVDNIIFAMLSFIDYSGSVSPSFIAMPKKLSECARVYREKYPNGENIGAIIPQSTNDLFFRAAESVRFRDVYVSAFRDVIDEAAYVQFAGVTFVLPDNSIFIAFRGTDDTLVGWREDFNLSFTHPVPAQQMAADYVAEAAGAYRGKIRIGGHSKGGNLSVYSAVSAPREVRDRIIAVYSNDGPGFIDEVLAMEGFRDLNGRLIKIAPQSSVIGMLLGRRERLEVVESGIRNGLWQHDPFSWEVKGTKFKHLPALSKQGKRHDEAFREWLGAMDNDKRRAFTEIFFGTLASTGAKTVSDLSVDQIPKLITAFRAIGGLDQKSKDIIIEFLRGLVGAMLDAG